MKKYFIFAALVTAGLLTSCSSSDDAISESPNSPIENDDNLGKVEIQLGVGTNATASTRGTGTVGGTDNSTNIWDAQKVNVYMFEKGTLNLAMEQDPTDPTQQVAIYDAAEFVTPTGGTTNTGVAIQYANDAAGDPNLIVHKYYPIRGNFDFWGFYIDDAAAASAVNRNTNDNRTIEGVGTPANPATATEVTVPFVINGTQDLMVAKTVLSDDEKTAIAAADGGTAAEPVLTRIYSAHSARITGTNVDGVQPNLSFQHLLTRLHFVIKGGNLKSCGWKDTNADGVLDAAPAIGDVYTGVFVKAIRIKSKVSGKVVAAYTTAPASLLSWEAATATDYLPAGADADGRVFLDLKKKNATTKQLETLFDGSGYADDAAWIAALTVDGTDWDNFIVPTATNSTTFDEVPVGEALLVEPNVGSYVMEVVLGQRVLYLEDTQTTDTAGDESTYIVKEFEMTEANNQAFTIHSPLYDADTAPNEVFENGKSYKVTITVYGAEEIVVKTTLEQWTEVGTPVTVVTE